MFHYKTSFVILNYHFCYTALPLSLHCLHGTSSSSKYSSDRSSSKPSSMHCRFDLKGLKILSKISQNKKNLEFIIKIWKIKGVYLINSNSYSQEIRRGLWHSLKFEYLLFLSAMICNISKCQIVLKILNQSNNKISVT